MSKDYDMEVRVGDTLRELWLHLTLLAVGELPSLSNSEAAELAADAYKDLTGRDV